METRQENNKLPTPVAIISKTNKLEKSFKKWTEFFPEALR